MTDKVYDVVIVGAGITGSILAKQIAEAGKSVLVLEAGMGSALDKDGFSKFVDRYYLDNFKTPTSPYPHSANAPVEQPGSDYYVQRGEHNYGSNYVRSAGGTTMHWMGTSLRFLPNDFNLKSKYGLGVNWPIDYEDLQSYYQMAEWELGVSANVEDHGDDLFADGYEFPMERVPQSYLDQQLDLGLDGLEHSLHGEQFLPRVKSTPAARNSRPRRGIADPRDPMNRKLAEDYRPLGDPDAPDERGQRCQGNSSCMPICPVQAKYSALKTLRGATIQYPERIEVLTQAVASRITIDPDSGRIRGIEYKRYYDPEMAEFTEHVARGRVYVVAAHAIETAKLLLASDAANSSDMVGRNLMDHPFVITWGLMPMNVGSFRGPGSTSGIPQFRDGLFRKQHAAFRIEIGNWGVGFPNDSPYSTLRALADRKGFANSYFPNDAIEPPKEGTNHPESKRRGVKDLYGRELKDAITNIVTRQFRFGFEFEQLPKLENRVTVDSAYKDAIGNHRPVIHYRIEDYCKDGIVAAKKVSDAMFQKIGAEDETAYPSGIPSVAGRFEESGSHYEYFGAGHATGTHRMGCSPNDSVVDPEQRTWDHKNLFLVGCGNFCTVGTANPTLTAAALAFRAAEHILRDLG